MPVKKKEFNMKIFLDYFENLGKKLSEATKLINDVNIDLRAMWHIYKNFEKEVKKE